jgi:hypothetical protein
MLLGAASNAFQRSNILLLCSCCVFIVCYLLSWRFQVARFMILNYYKLYMGLIHSDYIALFNLLDFIAAGSANDVSCISVLASKISRAKSSCWFGYALHQGHILLVSHFTNKINILLTLKLKMQQSISS